MSSSPSPKPKNKALEDTSQSRVRKFINDEASEDNDIDVDENLTSEEDTISSKDLLAVSDDDEMPFALALLAENARKAKRAVVSDDSDDDVEVVDQSDSAFNNTYGIKASTLGPPIGTRSSYKRKSAPVGAPSGKRVRLLATDNLSPSSLFDDVVEAEEEPEPNIVTSYSDHGHLAVSPTHDGTSTSAANPPSLVPSMSDLNELIREQVKNNFVDEMPKLADMIFARLQGVSTLNSVPSTTTSLQTPKPTSTPVTPTVAPKQDIVPTSPLTLSASDVFLSASSTGMNAKNIVMGTPMPATFGSLFSSPDVSTVDTVTSTVDEKGKANGDLVEETKRPVFLEDLESYKNNFDPAAPCEVFDLEIQDEVLKPLYVGLPPLPSDRWILTTYDPKNACNPEAGGRLSFSSWAKHSKDLNAVTVWNIMTFVQSGIYINPCRISPALCSTEQSGQNAAARRITIDKKTVISVMVGMCTESYLTEAVAGNGSDPRYKRYMHILQHNQEWERWQAFHCLVFGYEILYSHINENAIQLSSVLSTSAKIVKAGSSSFKDSVSSDMIGPSKSSKSPSPSKGPPKPSYSYQFRPPGSVRYTLSHDEAVPAFDARGAQIDFNKDIGNLAAILPAWAGEIPVGSFVIAGYTAGTFRGQVATQEKKNLMCLGCNLVWVVVCGTPKRRS